MKKVLLAIMMVGLFCGNVFAAATQVVTTTSITNVSKDNTLIEYIYPIPTTAGAATSWLKIDADAKYGAIRAIYVFSASEDLDVLVNQIDLNTSELPTDDTVIHMTGINLFFSPEITVPRVYTNGDSPSAAFLYVIIKNDGAIATNNGGISAFLRIIYERI